MRLEHAFYQVAITLPVANRVAFARRILLRSRKGIDNLKIPPMRCREFEDFLKPGWICFHEGFGTGHRRTIAGFISELSSIYFRPAPSWKVSPSREPTRRTLP